MPPPSHQSLPRPGCMRQVALFTRVGPSELGEKWPGLWLRSWSAEGGTGTQAPRVPVEQGHLTGVSQHLPQLQGPSPWPATATCILNPPSRLPPFCRDKARLVVAQRGRSGNERGEGKGVGFEQVGMLGRLQGLPACLHMARQGTEAQATSPSYKAS